MEWVDGVEEETMTMMVRWCFLECLDAVLKPFL